MTNMMERQLIWAAIALWGAVTLGTPATSHAQRFEEHVITEGGSGQAIHAADMDGDGDTDAALAAGVDGIWWFESDGGSPPSFTARQIQAGFSSSVYTTDIDSDGNTDVLSGAFLLVWHENNGSSPPIFSSHILDGGLVFTGVLAVFATDMDGDGDTDAVAGWTCASPQCYGWTTLRWYENDGDSPPSFLQHDVDAAFFDDVTSVYAEDMDGDGDTDVIMSSEVPPGFGEIRWYESDGGSPPAFSLHQIPSSVPFRQIFAADLDGDGDTDLLSASDTDTAWHESDGSLPPSFTMRILSSTPGRSVYATDLDGDGDADVVSGTDTLTRWYENDGNSPPIFTKRTISREPSVSIYATDVDGEGPVDVLSASNSGTVWHEQLLDLEVKGSCPGPVGVKVTGADKNTEVAVFAAANTNGFVKGGRLCHGTQLEVGEPFSFPPTFVIADERGYGSAERDLTAGFCWLEAIAFENCGTSGAVHAGD